MATIQKRISTLVDRQLPEFISSEYPKFSSFLQKYYEQLELTGQPLDIIQNLTKYNNIDTYEKDLLSEYTTLTFNVLDTATTIQVADTYAFPEANGYVMIDDEIIFYSSKTATSFIGCKRNLSGTTKLGDLYNSSTFKTVKPHDLSKGFQHLTGGQVFNISNLFLYAFVKNYESQYLASFPEESLKPEVDKRTLIKNIKQFYRAKGTEQSIKFIFNSIVAQDTTDIPSIYYPKDNTIKSSVSDWIDKYALKVKVISGDPFKVIGQKLLQEEDVFNSKIRNTFAYIDNVVFLGNYDGESIYEIILAPETVVGEFQVAQKTVLTKRLLPNSTENTRINVFSSTGWRNTKGQLKIGDEIISFKDKTVNQFVIENRSGSGDYPVNTPVYNYSNLISEYEENGVTQSVTFLSLGVVYNIKLSSNTPYSTEGDAIQISESGFETRNPVIFDKLNSSIRWSLNENYTTSSISGLEEVLTDISAIYEDEQYYYIASSGYPSYSIGNFANLTPRDQKHLKLIKKESVRNTELYHTSSRDVGIFLNGVLAYGYKDYDENDIIFGGVESINVNPTKKGKGYKNPPYVLIDGDRGARAKSILSGDVIERIDVVIPGEKYETDPNVTITSGRGAVVSATVTKDKVTKLTVINPGEYYSTPPRIVIKDKSSAGRLAEYTSIISADGKLIGFNKINEGKFYTQQNIEVEVVSIGSGGEAAAKVKRWKKNRYEILKNSLDSNNGYLFENFERSFGYGYAHIANPIEIRNILNDTDNTKHSPILGYAYDGNPIYGIYGYSDPLNPNSVVKRIESSYRLNTSRNNGPETIDFPVGSFIEDYRYQHRFGDVDENNGRYCITPDYPNGVYAYFITTNSNDFPTFPYILGDRFYSIPVESNYTTNISQIDVPSKARRLRSANTPNNGVNVSAIVETTKEGSISSATVESSHNIFSVGNSVIINNQETNGSGCIAEVSSLRGKNILSIESTETKAIKVQSKNVVYFFDKSIITQENTNVSGEVVGDIFSSNTFVLRNISGNFNVFDKLNSNIRIINLIVDKSSFYTSPSNIRLTNGKEVTILSISNNFLRVAFNPFLNGEGISISNTTNGIEGNTIYYVVNATTNQFQLSAIPNGQPISLINAPDFGVVATSEIGRGIILENVRAGNTVKVRVVDGDFITGNDYYLKSEIIDDTIGSRIFKIDELSKNVEIFDIDNNIALVTTDESHNVTENDSIVIDIIPDDAVTTTKFYVRKRIYQTVKLFPPAINTTLNDTGIGSLKLLNSGDDYAQGGSGVFSDIELLFADQTRCRDENGLLVLPEQAFIGAEGSPGNARATITVVNGKVTANGVIIGAKGKGYNIGDILVVKNADIQRLTGSLSSSFLYVEVSHVGLGAQQTQLILSDISGISVGDILKINNELMQVTVIDSVEDFIVGADIIINGDVIVADGVDFPDSLTSLTSPKSSVSVIRGILNTARANHFNGAVVSINNAKYNFVEGHRIGSSAGDAYIKQYDSQSQELTVVYETDQSLNSITKLSFSSTFFDSSIPAKLVRIDSVTVDANYKFEFSKNTNNGPWIKNPILEIQKYYKYRFITNHPSLAGSFLEFSPSRNRNIITTESVRGNVIPGSGTENSSFIDIKLGFGDASPTNTYTEKKNIDFTNYYYYDKSEIIDSDNSYLLAVDDPLQGEKIVNYVSEKSFAYSLDRNPEYDGSGSFVYTTSSLFAIGEIDKIFVSNSGKSYKKLPTVFGVRPNPTFECITNVNYDSINKKIVSISIDRAGKNYSKPSAVLITTSSNLPKFSIVKGNFGEIIAVLMDKNDYIFEEKPEIYIVETDVKSYFSSKNIGIPKNIQINYNGSNFYNDTSLSSLYTSHQILTISNFNSNAFLNGEIVRQFENGSLIAEGKIAKDGYRNSINILKLINVSGEFKSGLSIIGNLKRNTADVIDTFYSIFSPEIKSYYDNAGYYDSDRGKLSANNQKLADSYFYQDYSYVVKSKSPINIWRKLVEQTVHPAGFKMFGEVAIEATAPVVMPETQRVTSSVSVIELWNETTNKVTIVSTKQQLTQSIVQIRNTNIRRGKGSVYSTAIDTTEMLSYTFLLQQPFDGNFDQSGNRVGRYSFNMILPGFGVMNVANQNNLIITIDGIIQEPGAAYTVSGSTITFANPPLGERIVNSQVVPAQKFVGRMIRFKNNDLNSQYFRKILNIETDFDNINTRFPLYYDDGTEVVLGPKENLIVSLDGVIQENKMTPLIPATSSYYIDRTKTPNEIVFVDSPRYIDENNRTKFFAYSVGNYERLEVDERFFDGGRKGPFVMRSVLGKRTVNVDNDRTILVFMEGILQVRNRSYTITGSNIIFSEAPRPGQKINILYLYGRETEKKLSFYNFENNKFFNVVDILVSGSYSYQELLERPTIYQGDSLLEWESVGEVLQFSASSGNITRFVVRQQNSKFDSTKPLKFASIKDSQTTNEIAINPENIISISQFKEDDERNELVFKTKSGWMVGSELTPKYSNNLDVGDLVKVDGERDYRKITLIPELLSKIGHRPDDLIENNHYGQVGVTEYNGVNDGVGLSVIAGTRGGKVVTISWNNRKYEEYAIRITQGIIIPKSVFTRNIIVELDNPNQVELRDGSIINVINKNEAIIQFKGISVQPNAFGYEETPELVFIPQPLRDTFGNVIGPVTGGGASGFVVMNKGEIIDVVLTNSGSGYSTPPKVYVTRGYNILKSPDKVVNSRSDLVISPKIFFGDTGISRVITVIKTPSLSPEIQTVSDVRSAYDSIDITAIITPPVKVASIQNTDRYITSIITLDAPEIVSITSIEYQRLSTFFFNPVITTIQSLTQQTTVIADFGISDIYESGLNPNKYEFGKLGNRFEVFENIKFMTDFGLADLSEQHTLEMLEVYYPNVTIGDFADRYASSYSVNGTVWDLTWPSIQEHGAILDNSISETDTVIYIPNTSRFLNSGKLLLGDEIITYGSKLSDRFVDCVRGAENTKVKLHNAGDYLRSLV